MSDFLVHGTSGNVYRLIARKLIKYCSRMSLMQFTRVQQVSTVNTDVVVILVSRPTFFELKTMRPDVQLWVTFVKG